jgi:hypothetical protein
MAHARDGSNHDGSDGIIGLVRETADGLGQLIADHIKLARTEIVADAKIYGRQTTVLVIAGVVLAIGYALACVAAALALAPLLGTAVAFVCVGGLHLLAGTIAIAVALRRIRGTRVLGETVTEVSRSVSALAATTPPALEAREPPLPTGRRLS